MRPLAPRRLTVLAISVAVALGTAGPAVADELRPSRPATHAGSPAQLPDSSVLLAQAKALGTDDGRISAVEAERLKTEIEAVVDAAKAAAPAGLPVAPATGRAAPADPVTDVLATVQKAVADLLAAVTSLNPTDVVGTVTSTLTSVVNLVLSTLGAGGLPKPELPALPDVGGLPAQPAVKPAAPPAAWELPVKPSAASELPVRPAPPVR
ncbi:hypothetical protein [Streptomyces roseoviridis]|uniref:Secreted protein n=1 Tax=Streptomyces roseoviridis TaxID=67361 RepID=A0ABV5QPQ9_9ACTN